MFDFEEEYRRISETPLEEIKENIFFEKTIFKMMNGTVTCRFFRVGICQPKPEHALLVQKALKIMGYFTHTTKQNGKVYLVKAENRQPKSKEI